MKLPLALMLSLASVAAHGACSHVMRVSWSHWPPYSMLNAKGQVEGLDIELVQRIAKEAGCTLAISGDIPPKRQLAQIKAGEQDIQFAASITPERQEFAHFSPSYRSELMVLFAEHGRGKSIALQDMRQLTQRDWTVIAPFQGWYGEAYAAVSPVLDKENRLTTYKTTEQGLDQLNAKRGDLLLGDLYSFLYVARQRNMPQPDVLPVPVNDDAVSLMFSKKSMAPGDVEAFNRAIDKLNKNGELAKIIARYGIRK
ncbi:substrate-binding periplasmic protein [Rhodoferax aquaticus]|uniref:substrate-binding periplasmic protein n=1 Tax=Rhodoferax aquaticus TaxID=2527691 RepID=UPI00143D34D3|nr:transporter substrate-binding domain-containing protein [Rhodoferax aquaticus]